MDVVEAGTLYLVRRLVAPCSSSSLRLQPLKPCWRASSAWNNGALYNKRTHWLRRRPLRSLRAGDRKGPLPIEVELRAWLQRRPYRASARSGRKRHSSSGSRSAGFNPRALFCRCFETAVLDDLGPFGDFFAHALGRMLGGCRERSEAQNIELSLHIRLGEYLA